MEVSKTYSWVYRYEFLLADVVERHDPTTLSDFREEAHELLRTMLEKNDEAENRKVSPH